MNSSKPKMTVSAARKKLVAFIMVGVLLIALTPAVPNLFARFHLGRTLGDRMEWRVLFLGIILVVGPAFVLFKFKEQKD
jgi:hypothetical protein